MVPVSAIKDCLELVLLPETVEYLAIQYQKKCEEFFKNNDSKRKSPATETAYKADKATYAAVTQVIVDEKRKIENQYKKIGNPFSGNTKALSSIATGYENDANDAARALKLTIEKPIHMRYMITDSSQLLRSYADEKEFKVNQLLSPENCKLTDTLVRAVLARNGYHIDGDNGDIFESDEEGKILHDSEGSPIKGDPVIVRCIMHVLLDFMENKGVEMKLYEAVNVAPHAAPKVAIDEKVEPASSKPVEEPVEKEVTPAEPSSGQPSYKG